MATAVVSTVAMVVLFVGVVLYVQRLENWRSYAPGFGGGAPAERGTVHPEKPGGILRWLTTVDHKDIGLLYATFAVISFAWFERDRLPNLSNGGDEETGTAISVE